jgi:para-nitrobenzyl esterase
METVEVITGYGRVRGTRSAGVCTFRGVPYAAAPEGPLRFLAPAPPRPWDGVFDATAAGTACPQSVGAATQEVNGFARLFGPGDLLTDEDCLNLNVFAPDDAEPGNAKPVMVWIHGGAFRIGTGGSPLYDGTRLARRGGVVVVTINYRLGVLGFLNLPEVGPANVGLRDQIAALRWVQEEIASFGGDPTNVTIFGESAGAKSVECLVASPHARGLFGRAILQSTYDPPMDPAAAATTARELLAAVGVRDEPTGSVDVEALRSLPVDTMLDEMTRQAMGTMASGGGLGGALSGWSPVVDGDVLPVEPHAALAAGGAVDVHLVIGTTRDEAALFAAMVPMLRAIEDAALPTMVGMLVGNSDDAATLIELYRSSRGPAATPGDILVAAMTDRMFRQHSIRLADAASAAGTPTWMYLFDWCGTGLDGESLGACHALEVPFVFDTLGTPLGRIAGTGPDAEALVDTMQDAWSRFAREGNPSTESIGWPQFDTARRATAVFGPRVEVRDAPLDAERLAWTGRM